jgi:hypothetical protein
MDTPMMVAMGAFGLGILSIASSSIGIDCIDSVKNPHGRMISNKRYLVFILIASIAATILSGGYLIFTATR